MPDQFPKPWRLGRRLSRKSGPHYGFVTVYDATVDGDGDDEGRVIGFMQIEAAQEVVDLQAEVEILRAALEVVRPALHPSRSGPYLNGPILSPIDAEKLLCGLGMEESR